jgi:hypothetical protein
MSARIGGLPVPNTAFSDSRAVRRALENGALVEGKVTAVSRARGMAPILRVADERSAEILLLAQKENDLVFAVRTGASIVRLRPPLFGLPDVFEDSAARPLPQSVLVLAAKYDSGRVSIAAETEHTRRQRTIRAAPSLGWTLFFPFQWVIEGTLTEKIIGLVWLGCLIAPLGFWYAFANPGGRTSRVTVKAGVPFLSGATLFLVGLAVIPRWFGLPVSSVGDWLASFAGIALAYAAGSRVAHHQGEKIPGTDEVASRRSRVALPQQPAADHE